MSADYWCISFATDTHGGISFLVRSPTKEEAHARATLRAERELNVRADKLRVKSAERIAI
jgi:hypothetical protein